MKPFSSLVILLSLCLSPHLVDQAKAQDWNETYILRSASDCSWSLCDDLAVRIEGADICLEWIDDAVCGSAMEVQAGLWRFNLLVPYESLQLAEERHAVATGLIVPGQRMIIQIAGLVDVPETNQTRWRLGAALLTPVQLEQELPRLEALNQ